MRKLAIPAAFGSEIQNYRSRRHALNHLRRHQHRGLFPWNNRGCNDSVIFSDYFTQQLSLLRIEGFVLRLGISARVLRVLCFERKLHEPSAQTLHLLLDRRPHIVGRDHRTQPLCGRDRLQSSNSRPNHQYARWCNCARRRRHHRKHSGQRVSNHQHSFVSRNRSHGRQCIHALRPRCSRHQLNRERS